jgi:hypothetical protein
MNNGSWKQAENVEKNAKKKGGITLANKKA